MILIAVAGVTSLSPAFPLLLLLISLFFLFVCDASRCAPSLWFTPSNSRAPAAKKLLVFLRDFPHLLCVCIFSFSHSPPPTSTYSSLSHTLILCPYFFFFHTLPSPPFSLALSLSLSVNHRYSLIFLWFLLSQDLVSVPLSCLNFLFKFVYEHVSLFISQR